MPDQICSVNDSNCENCRRGMPRPHPYKKWVAQTEWCATPETKNDQTEEVKIDEDKLPF